MYKVGKVVTKDWSGQRLKVLTLDFFVLSAKIIQPLDSKPGSCNQPCISFHLQNVFCHG